MLPRLPRSARRERPQLRVGGRPRWQRPPSGCGRACRPPGHV